MSTAARNEPATADVFVVAVPGAALVWSPRRDVAALVNRAAVRALQACLDRTAGRRRAPAALAELLAALRTRPRAMGARPGPPRPPFLGILPTRSCNLACRYCDFAAPETPKAIMDLDLAAAAVDAMAAAVVRRRGRTLAIHFFGGEPFVAGAVVDTVVHRARLVAARRNLVPHFEANTNGVFDEARARFVANYFHSVVLPLDGPAEVHDRQRPFAGSGAGTFARVVETATLLSRSNVELCLRCCVTEQNVAGLPETVGWMCETFAPAIVNVETMQPTGAATAAGLRPPDPWTFAAAAARARTVAARHGVRLVYAAADFQGPRATVCPLGQDALIVAPDGRIGGCYLPESAWRKAGFDLALGHVSAAGRLVVDRERAFALRRLVRDKPRCARCFCRWTCAGGCHVRETPPGAGLAYSAYCIQTRLITAVTLLERLGAADLCTRLLQDRGAEEALALAPDDRLEAFGHA